jgi:glucokinase
VGATNLRVAVFEGTRLKAKKTVPTPTQGGPYSVAERIIVEARRLGLEEPDSVGVASIGPLDLERGAVVNTPNNPLRTFYLREPLSRELKARVVVANDCVAAVWGEKVLGRGRDLSDLAYITISSGIGGGFIVDGNLLIGWRGNAHEVGHLVVDYRSGVRCGCGGVGHWEAIASGSGIPRTAYVKSKSWKGRKTRAYVLASRRELDPPTLYRLAREKDEFAEELVSELNRVHAAGIASVAAAFDPKIVFMGGSIFLNNMDLMIGEITEFLKDYSLLEPPRIEAATFGEDAPLMGALALALDTPKPLKSRV